MGSRKCALFAQDATATGFGYQQLKVLQDWLLSRLETTDDVLFCDHAAVVERTVPGRQHECAEVKYYAAFPAFNNDEVNKAIATFFRLWVNGAYKAGGIFFLFEANAVTAPEDEENPIEPAYEGQGAALLQEWVAQQDQPDENLLSRIVAHVRTIIGESATDTLDAGGWKAFVSAIHWQPDNITLDHGMAVLVAGIDDMIRHLPLEDIKTQPALLRAALYYEVVARTGKVAVDEKPLTHALLDRVIKQAGAGESKWYHNALEAWKRHSEISHFDPEQFYEVITAARYCRFRSLRASGEHEQWQDLLHQYIHLEGTGVYFLRKAIYEYLFLITAIDPDSFLPGGTLAGMEDGINYYFDNALPPIRDIELEEDIALLSLVVNAQSTGQINIDGQLTDVWKEHIMRYLDSCFAATANVDDQCVLLELKGSLIMDASNPGDYDNAIKAAVAVYRQILSLLPQAHVYNMKRLVEILDAVKRTMMLLNVKGPGAGYLRELLDDIRTKG